MTSDSLIVPIDFESSSSSVNKSETTECNNTETEKSTDNSIQTNVNEPEIENQKKLNESDA